MSVPRKPGKSFAQMMDLIIQGHHIPFVFSFELLVAIFWEESFFTNVKQDPGTALGFGQVEPSEFRKFETDFARQHGYHIDSLPRRATVGKRTVLLGTLTDVQAVRVSSSSLRHNFHVRKRGKLDALHVYGGVFFKGKSSLTKADRLRIIQRWLDCEAHLRKIPDLIHPVGLENHVIEGLQIAKPFDKALEPEFRSLLFPKGSLGVPAELLEHLQLLQRTFGLLRNGTVGPPVNALQSLLNFKAEPSTRRLAVDGIFGPQTFGGVADFQRRSALAADGIVGPKTRGALTP